MKIREAKKADVKQIEGLSDKLMGCHLQFDEYYKLRGDSDMEYVGYFEALVSSKDSAVFVAEDNGTIVGYLAGKIEKRPPVFEVGERGWIDSAYVLEEHRGQGIGRELAEKMLRWFEERGIRYVELSVDSRNELGCSVWRSLGFETWQFVMKKRIQ